MTTIERMARGIAKEVGYEGENDWRSFVDEARSALEALREPSKGMKLSGLDAPEGLVAMEDIEAIFTAMIDQALSEGDA